MNRSLRALTLAAALALPGPTVLAQSQAPAEAADEPPRYAVEVVVFSQPPVDGERVEAPASDPTPLPPAMAWPLRDPDVGQLGYPRLPVADETLGAAARRIDGTPGYKVLWHGGWDQPGVGEDSAQWVALPRIESMPGFDGIIQVYRERFLHARVELRQTPDPETHWTLSQSRRLRGDNPHYFDHPALGVIVRVERIEAD
ncbi:hypothetical protein BBH56_04045 [Spiribacter roseus]|uniref:CsiV family protein n=1 Tax=Spiribacter roseus TaxID=1855875 RepID=UPI000F71CC7E|nr:hypothetical protein BBH56_04045 [Spiribacter roseus]